MPLVAASEYQHCYVFFSTLDLTVVDSHIPRRCSGSAGRTAFGLQEVWSGAMCPSTSLAVGWQASQAVLFGEDELMSSDLVALLVASSTGRLLRL